MRCWCGNTHLSGFGEGYLRCDACQTLVSERMAAPVDDRVRDDSADLYGRDYWFSHQTKDLDCPDIVARSRTDLAERCVHWMRTLLGFVKPPAKVLEIGCAHGGFVAMMRQAGYDAIGLELSPSIVDFAQTTFDVPVLQGAIEDQQLGSASFEAVVMMDVLEHLPDPRRTIGRCFDLLKPDGVLVVQTPAYPERRSLGELRGMKHQFPRMLDPVEHLYLFSESAARTLCEGLGAPYLERVPAIFDFYDMAFVASRSPLGHVTSAERDRALEATVEGRFIRAMLDLDDRRLALLGKYRELRDRAAVA